MNEKWEDTVFTSLMRYFIQSVYAGRMCLERCVQPLLLAMEDDAEGDVKRWASFRSEIVGFLDEFQTIGDSVQEWFIRDVLTDRDVSTEQRAKASTIKHDLCNRIYEGVCLLSCLRELLDAVNEEEGDCPEMLERVEAMAQNIKRWFDRINMLDLVSLSEAEPVIFLRQRFKRLRLIVEDSIPSYINNSTLNMILFHLVLNAYQHRAPDREPKVEVRQTSKGISVTDNGTGIKSRRMVEIEDAVRLGRGVKSCCNKGNGFGICDSVTLLRCLSKDNSKNAEMIVETLEGVGTRVTILWKRSGEREELFGDNYMCFSGTHDADADSLRE